MNTIQIVWHRLAMGYGRAAVLHDLIIAGCVVLVLMMVGGVMAFEDTMQNHPSDDEEQGDVDIMWTSTTTYSSSVSISQYPATYPYNKVLYLYGRGAAVQHTGVAEASNTYKDESTYWSFVLRYYSSGPGGYPVTHIHFYDKDGDLLKDYDAESKMKSYHSDDSWEFIVSTDTLYLYINGISNGSIGYVGYDYPAYMEIYTTGYDSGHKSYVRLDDVSTDGYVIGVGTSESPNTWVNVNSNNEIDVEWTVKTIMAYHDWTDSNYQIKVTRLDSGTVVNTTTLDKSKPNGFVIYNRSTLMPSPNYGTYRFDLLKDSVIMQSSYLNFLPVGSSGTLDWDKLSYVPGQNATISYAVSPFSPTDYSYYIRTYNINTGLVDTNTINAVSGTITENLDGWDTGSYYSLLYFVDKNDGSEYSVAYDTFTVADEVRFDGNTYDAENGSALGSAGVNFSQASTWYNTTSNSTTGYYELEGLTENFDIIINASKTNYTHKSFTFTPPTATMYNMNLYLFPTNITRNTSAVEGMVLSDALHQGIGNATVNIYNDTWSNTTTATTWGYYVFNNLSIDNNTELNETFNSSDYDTWISMSHTDMLSNTELISNLTDETPYIKGSDYEINYSDGSVKVLSTGNMTNWTEYHIDYEYYIPTTYHVNATKIGYENSTEYEVIVTNRTWTIQNIILPKKYALTVRATDSETSAPIISFTATVNGESVNTTNGTATFYLSYGLYTVSVASDGYYPGSTNTLLDADKSESISLTRTESEYYQLHYVRFKLVNVFGKTYPGAEVIVYTGATTDGDEYANATTGSDGAVTFKMTENTQYTLTFTNTTQGIDETLTIYPKDTEYFIYIDSFSWSPPENQTTRDTVDWWWTHERINLTYGWINFTYIDTAHETTSITYWINDSNDTNIYSFNTTYPDSWTVSQMVPANNTTYIVHFSADHPRFDSMSGSMRSTISFGGLRVSFGWGEQWMYDTVAVCAIIFIGLLFSATSVNVGAVICALSGWMFMWMGWLSCTTVNYGMMVLATIVAVGFAMRKGEVLQV